MAGLDETHSNHREDREEARGDSAGPSLFFVCSISMLPPTKSSDALDIMIHITASSMDATKTKAARGRCGETKT